MGIKIHLVKLIKGTIKIIVGFNKNIYKNFEIYKKA